MLLSLQQSPNIRHTHHSSHVTVEGTERYTDLELALTGVETIDEQANDGSAHVRNEPRHCQKEAAHH